VYLECHEQAFTLDVSERQVDASRVAFSIAIANDMLDLSVDAIDEAIRQLLDAGMITLS
jgi:hypothetical protein